jgi:hypothetical protein
MAGTTTAGEGSPMNVTQRRRMPAIVIGVLAAVTVVAAAISGYGQGALVVVLVVALLAAYVVRHQVRARLVYKRRADPPKATEDPPLIG